MVYRNSWAAPSQIFSGNVNIFNWSKAVYNQVDIFKGKRNEKRMLMTISKGNTVCPKSVIHFYKLAIHIKWTRPLGYDHGSCIGFQGFNVI